MNENRPRKVVPQDILDAMRQTDSELMHLQKIIELQSELIEKQRDIITLQKQSIGYLKEICDLKDIAFKEIRRRLIESE